MPRLFDGVFFLSNSLDKMSWNCHSKVLIEESGKNGGMSSQDDK